MLQINEERTKRLQLRLPRNELVAIEEFRFRARMPSRAAAVRELIRRGMGVVRRSDVDLDEPTHPGESSAPQRASILTLRPSDHPRSAISCRNALR